MIKGKRIIAAAIALIVFVFCATADLGLPGGRMNVSAADAKTDFKMQEFRLQTEYDAQATTGTGKFNRVGEKEVYLAVRNSKDFTAADFPGTFYFYWTKTSGNRDRDTSVLLGTSKAIPYSQAATDYPDFKGNWKIGDEVPVIICRTTVDTSSYEVGDRLYMWVYYDSEGKGSMVSKASETQREIRIEASTTVTMNPIASVSKGTNATISANVTSNYGVEEGTLHFYIGDKEIGSTDVTLTTQSGITKSGTGTITVSTDDMDVATHKVYAIFDPKEDELPNSKESNTANLTITAGGSVPSTNEAPKIQDKRFNDRESRDPVDVTFKVSDDKDIDKLTIEIKDTAGNEIEFSTNPDGTVTFTVTENDTYNITVTDEEGLQAIDEVVIDKIKEDIAPNIDDVVRDANTPGKVVVTADIDDDYTRFSNLVIEVKDADGNDIAFEKETRQGDLYDGSITFTVTKSQTITITATDDRGQTKTQTLNVDVSNQPPVIEMANRDTTTPVDGPVKIDFTVDDDKTAPKDLSVVVKDSKDSVVANITPDNDGNCSFMAKDNDVYTITVTDGDGVSKSAAVSVTNIKNQPDPAQEETSSDNGSDNSGDDSDNGDDGSTNNNTAQTVQVPTQAPVVTVSPTQVQTTPTQSASEWQSPQTADPASARPYAVICGFALAAAAFAAGAVRFRRKKS